MAPRRTRSVVPRLVALTGAAAALYHLQGQSPAYAVKGAWQGEPGSLKEGVAHVFSGLEPNVSFPAIAYEYKGFGLSLEDGKLNTNYVTKLDEDTTLALKVNDAQAWQASLKGQDAVLKAKGKGTDPNTLKWYASKESSVDALGDVKVEFNSEKDYNLTLTPKLAKIAGAELSAKVRATNDGVTGHLKASRALPGGAKLRYSVKNPVGVYEVASSDHVAELSAPAAGGEAALRVEKDGDAETYKGTYTREVQGGKAKLSVTRENGDMGYDVSYKHAVQVGPVPTDVLVGVDQDVLYGKVGVKHQVGKGVGAEYEAKGSLELSEEGKASLKHALKLSHDLGYAQLLAGGGAAPRLRVGYEFNA